MSPFTALYRPAEVLHKLPRAGTHTDIIAAATVLATYVLAQGVKLFVERHAGAFHDAWVVIPMGPGVPDINASLLDIELDQYGLELLSWDEDDPDLVEDGLKVGLAFKGGV